MNTPTQEQSLMRISVVIPVFNGGADLEKCLAAISASSYPVSECILVDDASTDGMVNPAAGRHAARVIRLDPQSGPAMARNRGVEEANGEIIFFTDADVLLHPDSIGKAATALQPGTGISAVFGCYDDQPENPSFISQYRNLFHHWVHRTGSEEASTFWTGCGAIRRDVFIEMGGFSQEFEKPSIEDIELGTRLRRSGHRIRLLKDMLGKHMKHWGFWNTIRTDVFQRAIPWMMLMLRDGQVGNDLNLNYKSRVATLLAGFLALSLPLLALTGHAAAILPTALLLLCASACTTVSDPGHKHRIISISSTALTLLAPLGACWLVADPLALIPLGLVFAIAATHLAFYTYVAGKRSSAFAIAVVPMQVIFFLGCAVSIPLAYIKYYWGKRQTGADQRSSTSDSDTI